VTRSLTTHDEIMAEIEKSSAVESRAAAAMDSASLPGGLGVGVSAAAAAAAAAATAASSSPLGALPGDLAAGAMVSPDLLALATGCIGSSLRASCLQQKAERDHDECDIGMQGAAPPPLDTLDLAQAKAGLAAGDMSTDTMQAASKEQLSAMTDGATAAASGAAAAATDEFTSKRQAMKDAGLGMGVKETGSSLSTLARALGDDGVRTEFHDAREEEKIPLKSRVKGAKARIPPPAAHAFALALAAQQPRPVVEACCTTMVF
jgi:hypothetical protein